MKSTSFFLKLKSKLTSHIVSYFRFMNAERDHEKERERERKIDIQKVSERVRETMSSSPSRETTSKKNCSS
jgi:hypothetical protein